MDYAGRSWASFTRYQLTIVEEGFLDIIKIRSNHDDHAPVCAETQGRELNLTCLHSSFMSFDKRRQTFVQWFLQVCQTALDHEGRRS